MKKIVTITALIITILACSSKSDSSEPNMVTRYFRFKSCPESSHGNWQDTSFVAATNDPKVIKQCLGELSIPLEERRLFPLGKIEKGSAGYNINDSHSFSWHFVEDSWELVELGIEIYDGCAYSDAELNNYVEDLGSYGGWGNTILEEITP